MEFVKAPNYPIAPMPAPMPMPAPAPMPMPMPMPIAQQPAPIMHKPVHNDIHLHASYQQTSFVFPKPVAVAPVAKVCSYNNNSIGSILVLFILLVIITRCICKY
ncbi:hypothetical protein [Paenibacillus aceris]|uniref:Spore coat protein n=1 Tax=Paenibacillus aceris TaxID=869555 RepID=A0ABS4I7H1_9BACL|nr:hypothetical protein [Paenibacillus aceris]MBP1966880.1 hypothetical protein [Paenibacillus aceris]NHW38952.1 hypothetical protein [Paenibacillus aceris]